MTLTIKREASDEENMLVLEDGEVITVLIEDFRNATDAANAVRIQDDEYGEIDASLGKLTHFNMERTDVILGNRYILPKIIKHGFFDHMTGEGEFPVVSFEDVYFVKCIKVENNVSYQRVDPSVFEFSMKHIKDIAALKEVIWKRYHQSMPKLSKEEIEEVGVAISTYEILGRKTFKFRK